MVKWEVETREETMNKDRGIDGTLHNDPLPKRAWHKRVDLITLIGLFQIIQALLLLLILWRIW